MYNGKYTMNKLRNELKTMTTQEKKQRLEELQKTLMSEKGKEKSNAFFGISTKANIPHQTRTLRKQIAMIKTSLNIKGYHYHPR